jgi:hypothetical protein
MQSELVQLSGYLTKASNAFSAGQIAQACSHLEKASSVLDQLIAARGESKSKRVKAVKLAVVAPATA